MKNYRLFTIMLTASVACGATTIFGAAAPAAPKRATTPSVSAKTPLLSLPAKLKEDLKKYILNWYLTDPSSPYAKKYCSVVASNVRDTIPFCALYNQYDEKELQAMVTAINNNFAQRRISFFKQPRTLPENPDEFKHLIALGLRIYEEYFLSGKPTWTILPGYEEVVRESCDTLALWLCTYYKRQGLTTPDQIVEQIKQDRRLGQYGYLCRHARPTQEFTFEAYMQEALRKAFMTPASESVLAPAALAAPISVPAPAVTPPAPKTGLKRLCTPLAVTTAIAVVAITWKQRVHWMPQALELLKRLTTRKA